MRESGTTVKTIESASGSARLLVIQGGVVESQRFPESGSVTIGRDRGCDVRVEDPQISRRHARIHLGPPLRIEDLRSANGTRVRGARIDPEKPAPLAEGEIVEIGNAMVIVHRGGKATAPRVWTHAYFEGRVEDLCARPPPTQPAFALVRIHCDRPVPTGLVADALAGVLRESDVLAAYGPGEHELLLPDTSADAAKALAGRMDEALRRLGVSMRVGLACWPRDGASSHLLLASASAASRGEASQADGQPVVADAAMKELYRLVERVAANDIHVLILGETGAGKEVLAERLHVRSPRAGKPFLRLNCAGFREPLLESELFGHERGAFTGAVAAKAGLLETADGGTVLLDEVGDMAPPIQARLLRVLEERQVLRVGGLKARPIDVRFVAATHRDLEAEVARGTFRDDLYYRLAGMTLRVPPLRERPAEIEALARAFVERTCGRAKRPAPALSREAAAMLGRYHWPGNVRELRNVMERAVLLCESNSIGPEHLPVDKMLAAPAMRGEGESRKPAVGSASVSSTERDRIVAALDKCGGNQSAAADRLGISRRTLGKRMDALDIRRPRKRPH